ncbi:MAG TPA: SRPBCC family protein [Acidimicrobiales bacterium]
MTQEDMDYGVLARDGAQPVLRMERRLHHPAATVWSALTEEEQLAAWFPTTIEGDRKAGAPLTFGFREVEMPDMEGRMLTFDPPTVMELNWGGDIVRFELTADGDGSILTLIVTFAELGKAARDAAGWHVCLQQLDYAVDGDALPWLPADRWKEVHPGYVERFGPAASTMGPPEEWERVHGDPGGGSLP